MIPAHAGNGIVTRILIDQSNEVLRLMQHL